MEVLLSGSYPKQLRMINQEPLIDILFAQYSTLSAGQEALHSVLEAVQYCGRGFRERHLRAQYLQAAWYFEG
jgi:hypothetical protein